MKEVPSSLREILDKCKEKLKICIDQNRFDYIRVLLTNTFCSALEGGRKFIETLVVSGDLYKRLRSSIQVVLVNLQHQLAMSFQLACRERA